jgi:hypothetical protein
MRCDRRLRSPVEHRLLLVIAQTCRVVECRVVSRRHRTVTNRLHDTFQLGRFLSASYVCQSETLRAWRGRVGRQISGRNSRVRGHGSSGGMAAVIRDSDRSFLLVPKTRNFDPFGQICRNARMQQPPGEPNRSLADSRASFANRDFRRESRLSYRRGRPPTKAIRHASTYLR